MEYINIKNLKSNFILENNFFFGTPTNLIICINNDKSELIKYIIANNSCLLISCNRNLPDYEYKLNTKNGCFTENCKSTNYKYEFHKRCYKECPDNAKKRENKEELIGIKFDENFFCKPICNETLPFEIISTQECVADCDINSIINKLCILNYKENSNIFDILLEKVEYLFTSNDYDKLEIEKGNKDIIKYNQMIITLTTTENQKNNEKYSNETTINLGYCERLLKEAYHIPKNETLFMKKIDVFEKGMMIPKIEFDVYYKLNGTNLIKLNLSYCSNSKIDISIPLKINEKFIDKYNSRSRYYNDICYIPDSDNCFDITIKDRQEEFIEKNRTVCQENCAFSEYDNSINKVKCSCDVKESSSFFENIKIDKQKIYENFININNIANINILVCYKALF